VPSIVFLELDRVRVKGKDVAVAICKPLSLPGAGGSGRMRERELFHEAPALFRAQRRDAAGVAGRRLNQDGHGAKHCAAFLERIAYLRTHPPGLDWDGAFTFTIK
jgi:adenylate cyclase